MALRQIEVPYIKGYDFGVGVDLASSSPMGKVVEAPHSEVGDSHGATTKFEIVRIHSTEELETKLGINVEASYGCGAFGAGVSARFDFAKTSKIQSNSLFMAVTASVALGFESINAPALTAAATKLASQPGQFAERYGNMFVRGIARGGMFIAVIQINVANSEESETISAELSGSYGVFSGSAKTTFDTLQRNYHSEITITAYHEGGPINLSMEDIQDPNELYKMLQKWLTAFQEDPNKNACPYSVTLAPISVAEGPVPPNAADIQHAQDIIVICAKQRSAILDDMNLLDFILQNPTRFDFKAPTKVDDVAQAFAGYQADFDLVAAAASRAMNDPTKAITPAEYAKQTGKSYPQGVLPRPMPTMEKGPLDAYATKGEKLAALDPLAASLRKSQPPGANRRGFDIGMGVAEGQTLPGPGKDNVMKSLKPEEQAGFAQAVRFSVDRNRNADLAAKGAAIAKKDKAIAKARKSQPSEFYTLGFDIATGLFGEKALGGEGHTAEGSGSNSRRDSLTSDAQRGFRAAVELLLTQKAR